MLRFAIELILAQALLLILIRPLLLWYLGIRKGLKLLSSIDESLKMLPAVKVSRMNQLTQIRKSA